MSPITRKEHVCWSQFNPVALFKINFVGCSVFIYCIGLNHIHISPYPLLLVCLAQKDNCTFFINSGKAIYTNSWSKWYGQTFLFSFLYNSCGHSILSSLSFKSTLFVSISSKPSSIVGVCWQVTLVQEIYCLYTPT